MTVWIVSLEWNIAPSEVTGDSGIVGVFADAAAAEASALATRRKLETDGHEVYEFSMRAGRHCTACGEQDVQDDGTPHVCDNADGKSEGEFCDYCAAELTVNGACDNDHDDWDIDVHVTEHAVQG